MNAHQPPSFEPPAEFVKVVEAILDRGERDLFALRTALTERYGVIGELQIVQLGWALCELAIRRDLDAQLAPRFEHALRREVTELIADPAESLWDEFGTPRLPHVDCPVCKDQDEVGSHFDSAWCCRCGWLGSLTAMRAAAAPASNEGAKPEPQGTATAGDGPVQASNGAEGTDDGRRGAGKASATSPEPSAPADLSNEGLGREPKSTPPADLGGMRRVRPIVAELGCLRPPVSVGDRIAAIGAFVILVFSVVGVLASFWMAK